jgi:hypothetical protein
MAFDLDRELALARLKLHKAIDRRAAQHLPNPPKDNRSLGQKYRRIRERLERKDGNGE